MKKISRKKRGFTIVELLMATLTMAILIIAIGLLMFYSWLGWVRNTRSVNMQRDGYLAMEQIAREIRNSKISEVTHDSDGIYFSTALGPPVRRATAVNILATDIAVFPNVNISGFNAETIDDTVKVSFTLFTEGDTDRNDYEITVKTRN